MHRVLIVEDQKRLQGSLRRGLEEEGYEVLSALTGEDGYYLATTQTIDGLVLDLGLPGRNGLEVLRDLRGHGFNKPVLILTSRDAVDDRVTGLDAGADDYLVKPFAFAELLARLPRRRNTPRFWRTSLKRRIACRQWRISFSFSVARMPACNRAGANGSRFTRWSKMWSATCGSSRRRRRSTWRCSARMRRR